MAVRHDFKTIEAVDYYCQTRRFITARDVERETEFARDVRDFVHAFGFDCWDAYIGCLDREKGDILKRLTHPGEP